MKTLRIKDICDKGSSNLKQKDVQGFDGKYPVYGASGVIGKINDYHQDKEYIAIVKDGSGIGRVSFMPAYSSVIGTLQYILPKQGYNIKYISYCLQSLDLASSKQGAAIPHIYFRDYGEFLVNVEENIDKQQQIVSFLDSEFEKIDALKANAETQLQAAKDLFQKALKETLTPKDGWEEKKLGEICDFRSGFAFKSSLFTESGEPIIRISDIQNGEIEDSKVVYFNLNSYKENLTKFKVYPNDILIAMSGATTGKVGINKTDKVFYLNQRVGVFRENTKILEHKYLYYFLNNKAAESLKLAIGAAQPNLSTEQINNFIVPIPSLTKQQAIADNLDTLSAKVKQLQENYNETITLCNDLKQSLLKRIFE